MDVKLRVECPYCGTKFLATLNSSTTSKSEVIECDSFEGGCENPFVITHILEPQHKVSAIVPKVMALDMFSKSYDHAINDAVEELRVWLEESGERAALRKIEEKLNDLKKRPLNEKVG